MGEGRPVRRGMPRRREEKGERLHPTPSLVVQGLQPLCLAGSHDVDGSCTAVSPTAPLSLPTALMRAVAPSPRGVAARLWHEAAWSRGFLSRESTSGSTRGCVMTLQAQQTRRRPRVAAPHRPGRTPCTHPVPHAERLRGVRPPLAVRHGARRCLTDHGGKALLNDGA